VHHVDDIDTIWAYAAEDAIRTVEDFTKSFVPVFRNLVSRIGDGADIL
jgi:hypothetical protein